MVIGSSQILVTIKLFNTRTFANNSRIELSRDSAYFFSILISVHFSYFVHFFVTCIINLVIIKYFSK